MAVTQFIDLRSAKRCVEGSVGTWLGRRTTHHALEGGDSADGRIADHDSEWAASCAILL